jgi:AraC-like DNA-binding protein
MDNHFYEPIDLGNIADEAYFSKFHFIRLFKTIYGYTPHQYLIKVRIEKAKELLQENNSVSQACFGVGFCSVSTFAGLFKKITKRSPSVYQQEYKKRLEQINSKPLQFIPGCFARQKGWTENSNFEEAL